MKELRPHIGWLLALIGAFILIVGLDPARHYAYEMTGQKQKELSSDHERLALNLRQLRDDAALAERLSKDINANDVEKYLAPSNRLEAVAMLDPLAFDSRLSNFSYTLSPEQPYKSPDDGSDMRGIVQSSLTLQAEAALDNDTYRFLENLPRVLPGRLRLEKLSVERIKLNLFEATNVRMTAVFEWVANESRGKENP